MKKLIWVLLAFFALSGMAMAAVNLNTATKEELQSVKGIGPKKADAIIEYRKKNGLFKTVDDLKYVAGFGSKSVAKVRLLLIVKGGTPAKVVSKPVKVEGKQPVPVKVEKK